MTYTNRKWIPERISNLQPFQGNTMWATVPEGNDAFGEFLTNHGRLYETDESRKFDGRLLKYVIFSYQTPIAAVDEHNEVILVEHKFSPTTSNHQTLAREGLRLGGFLW